MQVINGNITDFGFGAGVKTLQFEMVSRFLKPMQEMVKKSITTQPNGSFTTELLENDALAQLSFYKVTINDEPTFSKILYVPFSSKASLHIGCLKQIGGCGNVITYIRGSERHYEFENSFLNVLDKYFTDEKTYLTRSQAELLQNFYRYAQESDETKKCDLLQKLDEALAAY